MMSGHCHRLGGVHLGDQLGDEYLCQGVLGVGGDTVWINPRAEPRPRYWSTTIVVRPNHHARVDQVLGAGDADSGVSGVSGVDGAHAL